MNSVLTSSEFSGMDSKKSNFTRPTVETLKKKEISEELKGKMKKRNNKSIDLDIASSVKKHWDIQTLFLLKLISIISLAFNNLATNLQKINLTEC